MGETKIWLRLLIVILVIGLITVSLGLGGKGCVPWQETSYRSAITGSSNGNGNGNGGNGTPSLHQWFQTNFPAGPGFINTQPANLDEDVILALESNVIWDTPQTVDSTGMVGLYTSLALDSANNVYISYYDEDNHDLKCVTDTSGSWVTHQFITTPEFDGEYTSIALDNDDNAHISYYDATNANLMYLTNASGSWVDTQCQVTGERLYGKWSSIALGPPPNNYVHIGCYQETDQEVGYATNSSGVLQGGWVVTAGINDGEYTSIALDSNNNFHISCYDATNQCLIYITDAGAPVGSVNYDVVDSTGVVGQYTSLAIDSNDNIHISYYDAGNGDLKYATGILDDWTITTVDSTGIVGLYTSLALDSNDNVHISYYDAGGNGNLKYANIVSGSVVVTTTLDSTSTAVGQYTSLAHGPYHKSRRDTTGHQFAHISYYDAFNGDLKYISQISSTGYAASGSYTSAVIAPAGVSQWKVLTFTKSDASTGGPAGTTLTVDVLDTSNNPIASNVTSGTNLSALVDAGTYPGIKLRANFATTDDSQTPTLFEWSVNYETIP